MKSFFTYLTLVVIGLTTSVNLKAQAQFSIHIDAGENNVSNGLFIKTAGFGSYQFDKTEIGGGFQFNVKYPGEKTVTGSTFNVDREFSIKEFPFKIQGLFMYNPFSDLIHESNWGVVAKIEQKHFKYKLGTNFRTYRVTQKASNEYDVDSNNKIDEYWNLMYLIQYNLKTVDHNWNVGLTLTNIDHFIINQETNPIFYLHGRYRVNKPLTLFIESWYKSAGSLNISVNYFGYFFRTGLIWKLDLNK